MIRYIVHLADLHIRANAHGQLSCAMDSLQASLAALPVLQTVVVVCGDVIDTLSKTLNATTIDLVRKLFNILNHAALRTIVILGNHDAANGCLKSFFPLWSNITLLLEDSVVVENVRFYVLPCSNTSNRPDTDISMPKPQQDLIAVGLYHGPCHPSSTPRLHVDPGYQLILLGDQHTCIFSSLGSAPQRLGVANPGPHGWHGTGWAYAGSMVQRSRNEAWDDHGMLVWDLNNRSVTFHPLTCGIVHLTVKHLSDDGQRAFDEKGEKWVDWGQLHRFIQLGTCRLSVRENVDLQALTQQVPNGMRFEIAVTPGPKTGDPQGSTTWDFQTGDAERFTANDGPGPWKAHLCTTITNELHRSLMERFIDDPRRLATGYGDDEKLTRFVDAVLDDSSTQGDVLITVISVGTQGILGLQKTHVVLAGDGRRLTLLEGPNGSGKSSIIDSIFLALYGRLPANRHGIDGVIATGSYLRQDAASGSVQVELLLESSGGTKDRVFVTRTYTRRARSVESKVSINHGTQTVSVDWLKRRLPPFEDVLATSLMNQANDGSLFHLGQARDTGKNTTTTNLVRDLFTRLCCLPQLTRYIDLLRCAKKLRDDECKKLRQELADWQGPLPECKEPDAKRAAAVTARLGVAREQKRHMDRLCPRVVASAMPAPDDTPETFFARWGDAWMELSSRCNNLLIEVRAHLGHGLAHSSHTSYEAVSIPELQQDAQSVQEILGDLLRHRSASQKAGAHAAGAHATLVSLEETNTAAETELTYLLSKHHLLTVEQLLAEARTLPAAPEWDQKRCHAVLEEVSPNEAPAGDSTLADARAALARADTNVSEIETQINATWLQTSAADSHWLWTQQQVTRAFEAMQQHGDNAAVADRLLTDVLHRMDRQGDISCMDRWTPHVGLNAEQCGACKSLLHNWNSELSALTRVDTPVDDITELRNVLRFFQDRPHYSSLLELYSGFNSAVQQRNALQQRLDALRDTRVAHAELLQDKQRAEAYMSIHQQRFLSKEVLADAPRAQKLSTSLRMYQLLIEEYRVAALLGGVTARFEGRLVASMKCAAQMHSAVSEKLEGEIRCLETEGHRLAQAVLDNRHRALVLSKTNRLQAIEPECDTLQMMLAGLEVYRSNLMEQQVQTKLTGIVTRFLRPLGLGLVGVKDQHKRFKWLVTKDGSTYEHHLASGFEKGIIDFMARVAMCLVSSSASRFTQLFIDEGLLAADVTNRSKLGELISQISQDFCGIIMVSHMPEMTEMTEGSISVVRVPVSPTVHHRGNMGKRKFNDMISMKNANND